jgi:hypothetical protein
VEDVEVGHIGGDAVELVHQRRLDIIEKLGAHKARRLWRFAFLGYKKLSVFFLSIPEVRQNPYYEQESPRIPVSVLLSSVVRFEIGDFENTKKSKNASNLCLYSIILFLCFYSVLFVVYYFVFTLQSYES